MKSYARVSWMTAAVAAALLAATAAAADPKDKDAKDKEAPAKVDKDVEAWVKVLVEKIADRHDSIRESARQALVAVGKPALPALQKLAEGDDGAAAEAAKHVIAHIAGGGDGHHGRHGFPGGMGPQHPGMHGGFPPPHPGAPGSGGFAPHPGGAPGFPPGPPGGSGPPPGGPPGLGGPGGPGAMIERAMKDLNLTDAQKTKVKEVLKVQGEKAHETFEKMHEDFLKAIKGVLDEEQYKKLEKNLPMPRGPGDLPGLSDKPKGPKE